MLAALVLTAARPSPGQTDAIRVPFSQAAGAVGRDGMDGAMGLEYAPDMVDIEEGKLVLRARSRPWGAKTATYLYRSIPSAQTWTAQTRVWFEGSLLAQQAGLFAGSAQRHVRLVVGRPGQPYDVALVDPRGQELRAPVQGFDPKSGLWLRLVWDGSRAWGLFSVDGHKFVVAGSANTAELGDVGRAGLCFVDDNPYHNEDRIPAGSVPPGRAAFDAFTFTRGIASDTLAALPHVFVKGTLHSVDPTVQPTKLAVTVYAAIHERQSKFFVHLDGSTSSLSTGWHAGIPWAQLPDSGGLRGGESTGWSDWTEAFAALRPQSLVAVALWQDGLAKPPGLRADNGNVAGYDLELAFATAPREEAIVSRVRHKTTGGTLGLYVPANEGALSDWGPGIRTVYQYTVDRLAAYANLGLKPLPADRPLAVTVNAMKGYHATFFDPATEALDARIRALLGENSPMVLMQLARVDPWDPDLKGKLRDHITRSVPNPPAGRFVAQLGDEPHLPSMDALQKLPAGVAAFRAWLKGRVQAPSQVGATDWDAIMPLAGDDVTNRAQARLHYHSVWFLQHSAAQLLKAYRDVCHELWGDRVTVTTDVYYAGFTDTLDYFVESRLGATDRFGHHFGGEFSYTFDLFDADMLRSASASGQTAGGFLYFACRINEPEGVALTGHAALAARLNYIRYYGYGPLYAGWEWFSDDRYRTEVFGSAARASGFAVKCARHLQKGVAPQAQVATLLSRSAEVWSGTKGSALVELFGHPQARAERARLLAQSKGAGGAEGWSCERDMIHCALHWANVPVDVLPEEDVETGKLDGRYRVLYVYAPNVSAAAQERLARWVRAGGVLYLGPQAATRDETNGPLSLLASLTGKRDAVRLVDHETKATFEQKGQYGETWRMASNYTQKHVDSLRVLDTVRLPRGGRCPALGWKEVLGRDLGKAVARYSDRRSAVCVVRVGKGRVVKSGTCLGAAYARTAQPSVGHAEWSKPPAVPGWRPQAQTWQRKFSAGLQDLILHPLKLAGLQTPVRVSIRGVDSALFELPDGSGAILMLGKYTSEKTRAITATANLEHSYSRARRLSTGDTLAVRQVGGDVAVSLPLEVVEVVELLP